MFKNFIKDVNNASPLTYMFLLLSGWKLGEITYSVIHALLKGYGLIK